MPLFTVRIFKSYGARAADRRWSNTYEVDSSTAVGPGDLLAFANSLADAERVLHLQSVSFLSAIVSTWAADSHPYDPSSFTTLELNGVGLRGGVAPHVTAMDTNVTLMAKFTTATGRSGKRFYRGVLLETDVMMGGDGYATFDPAGPFMVGADWTNFQTAMAPMIGTGTGNKIALISADGTGLGGPRRVLGVTRGAVVTNKRNHRYFDRA